MSETDIDFSSCLQSLLFCYGYSQKQAPCEPPCDPCVCVKVCENIHTYNITTCSWDVMVYDIGQLFYDKKEDQLYEYVVVEQCCDGEMVEEKKWKSSDFSGAILLNDEEQLGASYYKFSCGKLISKKDFDTVGITQRMVINVGGVETVEYDTQITNGTLVLLKTYSYPCFFTVQGSKLVIPAITFENISSAYGTNYVLYKYISGCKCVIVSLLYSRSPSSRTNFGMITISDTSAGNTYTVEKEDVLTTNSGYGFVSKLPNYVVIASTPYVEGDESYDLVVSKQQGYFVILPITGRLISGKVICKIASDSITATIANQTRFKLYVDFVKLVNNITMTVESPVITATSAVIPAFDNFFSNDIYVSNWNNGIAINVRIVDVDALGEESNPRIPDTVVFDNLRFTFYTV
jgi:hypothetical protein